VSARDEVERAVGTIDRAWTVGPRAEMRAVLERCFCEDVVVRYGAALAIVAQGREDCIGAYADFVSCATIAGFRTSELAIDVCGPAAVATYQWEIDYAIDGTRSLESGRDVLVFRRVGDAWLVCWRAMLPATATGAGGSGAPG
jgi:ketosteroid isomerase-like protein